MTDLRRQRLQYIQQLSSSVELWGEKTRRDGYGLLSAYRTHRERLAKFSLVGEGDVLEPELLEQQVERLKKTWVGLCLELARWEVEPDVSIFEATQRVQELALEAMGLTEVELTRRLEAAWARSAELSGLAGIQEL